MAETRARLDQPRDLRRRPALNVDREAFGRLTERIARFLGTGRYLAYQTITIILWLVVNTVPGIPHFDPYTFTFLTLVLSLQAAYAAPLILLAQNRQDDRDRANIERDREVAARTQADTEFLARELAAVRLALSDMVTTKDLEDSMERMAKLIADQLGNTHGTRMPPDGQRAGAADQGRGGQGRGGQGRATAGP